jgi:hypothetical protein
VVARGVKIDHIHAHTKAADDSAPRQLFDDTARDGSPLNQQAIGVTSGGDHFIFGASIGNGHPGIKFRKHSFFNIDVGKTCVGNNNVQ